MANTKPSGNAVKGASVRPVKYPVQLVIMVTQEVGDRVEADRERHGLSKSEVARTYIEAGIAAGDAAAEADDAAKLAR